MADQNPKRARGPLGPEDASVKINFQDSYDTSSLKGQSALITGGATGIGAGTAIALAEAGVAVTIVDINEEAANAAVADLTSKGHKAQFVKTDVTSWTELVAAFKSAVAFGGGLDIVMPAAGISSGGTRNWLADAAQDEKGDPEPVPIRVLDVNLDAVFNTAHLAMYFFKQNPGNVERSKQLIFVASMGGYTSMTGAMDYCTSKWAVRGLFRSLRGAVRILGEEGPPLRCNLIAPTFVKTPMVNAFVPYLEKMGLKLAEVSDCTDVVLRMASDENVWGRSCAIAADSKSFDLCDDAEGLDAGREVSLSIKENRFGYTRAEEKMEKPKKMSGETFEQLVVSGGTTEPPAQTIPLVEGAAQGV